jgi:hypothetical protein
MFPGVLNHFCPTRLKTAWDIICSRRKTFVFIVFEAWPSLDFDLATRHFHVIDR